MAATCRKPVLITSSQFEAFLTARDAPGAGDRWRLPNQEFSQFVLDVGEHATVTVTPANVEQHKAVQRVIMASRMNLGVHDAVARPSLKKPTRRADISGHARRDHDFDAVPCSNQSDLDDLLPAIDAVMQGASVPGDFHRPNGAVVIDVSSCCQSCSCCDWRMPW